VGPIRDIVRSFAGISGVELTVVCGRAPGLEKRVTRLASEAGVTARVLGFEKDMAARMAEAHVIVGKAGGLTVSEAMTSGRPMIIAGAVPGNEGINANLVARADAGHIAEPADVGMVVNAMRVHRMFSRMGRNARAMVMTHAADRVIDVAEGTLRLRNAGAAA
jgi:processive 1,2-diacylglycerol beta-glucosyltransferase